MGFLSVVGAAKRSAGLSEGDRAYYVEAGRDCSTPALSEYAGERSPPRSGGLR